MWISYSYIVSLVVNLVLAVFLLFFVQNGIELYGLLALSESEDTDLGAKKNESQSPKLPEKTVRLEEVKSDK
jgi:hypothetical protein